ncbi:MAG: hypothetical protein MUO33_05550 [Sedimentisphaerales bacterium]|nr:hypothetical protein [Sedimentisphaerales bacterium]
MSNRIDFFQSAESRLAIPAATVSILLDGTLCTELEPIEIVRSTWPDFSWARFAYNPAGQTVGQLIPAEQIQTRFGMGKSISVRQVYSGLPAGTGVFGFVVFDGQIEAVETGLGRDGERVEISARDFSANLKRVTVYGRRVSSSDDSTVLLSGVDTVFNPDGKPNAGCSAVNVNGSSYTVFCAEPSQSRFWTYAQVIDYLLCEYLPPARLQTPSIQQLQSLTDNQMVHDLDVTGLNLAEAIRCCCERVGLEFKFLPRLAESGPSQAIVFYKGGTGRIVELNYQQPGQQLSISRTNIAALHSRKSLWPVTHRYIGQGDFKVYEATFDLVKAWDPADENTDYGKFSPSSNPDFYKVKDVYRKWCLNEAGQYTGAPYNRGPAFDFSKVFQTGSFAHCRRRFWPALTTDKQGNSLGYYLQVSYDDGQHWWQYLAAFSNLLDECGVWFSSDRLDVNTWVAALKVVLKFRITASVISDERLSCVVADGPVNSAAPVIEQLITLPRQFKFRKLSGRSIFSGGSDQTLGVPDEVDDSAALYEFLRRRAADSAATIESIDMQQPILGFDYWVGDIVTSSPESRDLLGSRSDSRGTSRVVQVQMDFKSQCTNLKIVCKR